MEIINKDKMIELIDLVVEKTFTLDYTWDWAAGVAFYGVARAYEVSKNEKYLKYLKDWVDKYIQIGLPKFTVNAVSIGHCLITLYQATNDETYLEIIKQKAEYLTNESVRFGDGVFQHTVSQNYNFPEQAWADTLFMAGFFLVRVGKLFDNKDYFRDGLNQFYWHIKYLQDKNNNLFYHAWDNIAKNNMSGIHWARANAWVAITMSEVIKLTDAFEPMFVELMDCLRDQLSALVRLQSEDGMWHTVLDDSNSYTETSATAGIATAIIIYSNISGMCLYKECIQKATEGIISQIDESGKVLKVSGGTAVMNNLEDYRNIPNTRMQGWGQGLALAFLAELL